MVKQPAYAGSQEATAEEVAVPKTLELVQQGSRWLIVSETLN